VLPAAFASAQLLISLSGGLAAAIAIGAFIGQALTSFGRDSDLKRRRDTAVGGFCGLAVMIGILLLSAK
jgi:hypothetical protein